MFNKNETKCTRSRPLILNFLRKPFFPTILIILLEVVRLETFGSDEYSVLGGFILITQDRSNQPYFHFTLKMKIM